MNGTHPPPVSSFPLAFLSQKMILINHLLRRCLFRNLEFTTIFLVCAIATFPLLVPPFFIPLYCTSLGLSSSVGAGLVAGFNISSAIGRFVSGFAADLLGHLNTLFIGLFLTTVSLFFIWPLSNSVGPLAVFVVINGFSNGGFFATIPTTVGTMFGSQRVSVAMGMVVTGWAGGYLMVCWTTHVHYQAMKSMPRKC